MKFASVDGEVAAADAVVAVDDGGLDIVREDEGGNTWIADNSNSYCSPLVASPSSSSLHQNRGQSWEQRWRWRAWVLSPELLHRSTSGACRPVQPWGRTWVLPLARPLV